MHIYLAMEKELLVLTQQNGQWQAEPQLAGMQITCVTADPQRPERVYCGTFGRGLWRSNDAGQSWEPIGDPGAALSPWNGEGIHSAKVTAVAVSMTERSGGYGVVYAGTEPGALFRSEDGGNTWWEMKALRSLPSAPTWSFPPRPDTNHVRWITPDPLVTGRLFVAVEAGALVRSLDGGEHWEDRRPDGPYDTHTLVMHPLAPDRLYSSAGDGFGRFGRGYNESHDGGNTWQRPDEGLQYNYLWSVALDPADPDTIVVSGATSPAEAHGGRSSVRSFISRKQGAEPWRLAMDGLPDAEGTVVASLTSYNHEPHMFYALTNKGLYRSPDTGVHWEQINVPWKPEYERQHQQAIVVSEA